MPIYEYQCINHVFEKIMPISMSKTAVTCKQHKMICTRIWSLPAPNKTPDDSKSNFVYFKNERTGEVDFTSTPQVYQRPGFAKYEARNLSEREAVEKKIRQQDDLRLSVQHEKRDFERHHSESARHSELRNYINQGVIVEKDSDGKSVTIPLDEPTKNLLKISMERSTKIAPKRRNSEIKFDVNHSDKNNRGTRK